MYKCKNFTMYNNSNKKNILKKIERENKKTWYII